MFLVEYHQINISEKKIISAKMRVCQIIAVIITAIVLLFTIGIIVLKTYTDPGHKKVADAGFVEKISR